MSEELYSTQMPGGAFNMDATLLTTIHVGRRDRDARPHFLERIEGSGPAGRIKLDRPEMTLGRGEETDITVPTQRASRKHAILTRNGADYAIRDNDSRNGVFLNGVKIYSAELRDGDVVQIADSVFVYHDG